MEKQRVLISVIVPVYNAASYLRACLDSLLAERADGLEFILVDDGSSDGSADICASFAAQDSRITLLSKNNGGASSARNMGIRAATGLYLLFADADDTIVPGSLTAIARHITRDGPCDVTLLSADRTSADGSVKKWTYPYDRAQIYGKRPEQVLDYLTRLSRYPVSPCVKLLRRGFVMDNGLFFTEGIVCEDVDHTCAVLLSARTFDYINIPYYNARVRPGSVMTAPENAARRFDSTMSIINKWLRESAANPSRSGFVNAFLAAQFLYLCAMYRALPKPARAAAKPRLRALGTLLAHGRGAPFRLLERAFPLFGVNAFSLIMKVLLT